MLVRVGLMLLAVLCPTAARAEAGEDAVRAVIAAWYDELRKGKDARPWALLAPDAVVAPPCRPCRNPPEPQPRALKRDDPPFPTLLAVRAQKFTPIIESLKVETMLARARVWERGWFYAWALKRTTQAAAAATFILERRDGEGWKIILYTSSTRAIHPDHRNEPMPDLVPKDTEAPRP